MAALPQWELSVKVVQLLGLRGPWWRQVCRDMDCLAAGVMALSESFFKPLVAGDQKASLASLSPYLCQFRHVEGVLLCRSVCQALKGAPWVGSYSVVQCIRRLMAQPLYCSAANYGVCRGESHTYIRYVWLSSTPCFHGCPAFLHRHFPPQSPPSHPLNLSSAVNSSPCPGIASQSLNSNSQLLQLPRDLHPCPGYVWLQQGLSDSHSI